MDTYFIKNSKLHLLYIFIFLAVLISRLPFIFTGEYGLDPDAWLIIGAAERIHTYGEYFPSRFPGYPVVEAGHSFFFRYSPWVHNFLSAFLSALGAVFFAGILKRYKSKDIILTCLSMYFLPAIFINSTNSMDYIWTFTFIIIGLYYSISDRAVFSGVFSGLAIGARLTSAIILLPFSYILYKNSIESRPLLRAGTSRSFSLKKLITYILVSNSVALICFLPAFIKYGKKIIKFSNIPHFELLLRYISHSIQLFGLLGLLFLCILFINIIYTRFLSSGIYESSIDELKYKPEILAVYIATFLLIMLIYLKFPHESEYLLPAIPFLFIILSSLCTRRIYKAACLGFIVSGFILSCDNDWTVFNLKGAILKNRDCRVENLDYIHKIIKKADRVKKNGISIVGSYLINIEILLGKKPKHLKTVLSPGLINDFQKKGYDIYYIDLLDDFIGQIYGVDIKKMGVKHLFDYDKKDKPLLGADK